MKTYNKKCLWCGKEINGCSCEYAWRNIACCPEHFAKYVEKQSELKKLKTLFRIETTAYKTADIVEYDFNNNIYKSETKSYTIDDISAFIIPKEKMKEFIELITKKNNSKRKNNNIELDNTENIQD